MQVTLTMDAKSGDEGHIIDKGDDVLAVEENTIISCEKRRNKSNNTSSYTINKYNRKKTADVVWIHARNASG